MEIWKDIKGFEGKYEIGNLGRIRSLSRFKVGKSNSSFITKERILSLGFNYVNTYDSINSASLYTDIIPYSIKLCADGIINQAGGYIWKYVK